MHPLIVSQTPFFFLRKCSVSTTVCQYKYHRFLCICIPALPKKPWWYPTVFSCHVGKRLPGVLCWAVSSARSYGCWICACIAVLWGGTVILGSRSCCCNERPLFFLLLWFPCVESLTSFPEVFWIFFLYMQTVLPAMKGYRQQTTKFLYRLVGSEDLLPDHSIVSPYTSRILKPYIRYRWSEIESALHLGNSPPFMASEQEVFLWERMLSFWAAILAHCCCTTQYPMVILERQCIV